jgi:hypothetical protein
MSDLADLRYQLKQLQEAVRAQDQVVWAKMAELREAKESRGRLGSQAMSLTKYIHELEGIESGCEHDYLAEPSGRGIGYDERCRRCGYFRTPYPVF